MHAYAAYHLGDGPDAEDVTSEVFENAVRYRDSYDPRKGEPLTWLIGIARHSVAKALAARAGTPRQFSEVEASTNLEVETVERLTLYGALATLGERDRDLLALRYAFDLGSREIGVLTGLSSNAVAVALHRALARLRAVLEGQEVPIEESEPTTRSGRGQRKAADGSQ